MTNRMDDGMLKVTLYSIAIAVFLAAVCTFGQEQSKRGPGNDNSGPPDKQKIIEQLQGKWIVTDVRTRYEGTSSFVEESEGRSTVIEFRGTTFVLTQDDDGKGKTFAEPDKLVDLSIDASKTPVWIETDDFKGILRLEGDSLIICVGIERPTRFDLAVSDKPERYAERHVLNRIKSKDGKPSNAATPQVNLLKGLEQLQGTWTCIGILGGQSFLKEYTTEVPDIEILGDTATALRKFGEKRTKCKITVDDSKKPMWIDISNQRLFSKTSGLEFNPKPLKGVFRIEGDKLTICTRVGAEHPADFDLTNVQVPYVFKKKQ